MAESEETVVLLNRAAEARSEPLPVTWLHRIETVNAFQLYVFAGRMGLLHVASALLLRCDTFWSFDPKASQLARLEGLQVR